MNKPIYTLLPWIDVNKLDWDALCTNPNLNDKAIEILKTKPNKINWDLLLENEHPNVITLLTEYPEEIDWSILSRNSNDNANEL